MSTKSIVEEALLEAKSIENAIKKNSKGILAEAMKQDIDEIVKASIEDTDDEEQSDTDTESQEETPEVEDTTNNDFSTEVPDMGSEDTEGDEEEDSDIEASTEIPDMGSEDTDLGSEEDELGQLGDDSPEFSEKDDVVDLTNATDGELLKVFKRMSDTDEIEVVKSSDKTIDIKDKKTGAEYRVEMNENEEEFSLDGFDEGDCDECGGGNDEEENSEFDISLDEFLSNEEDENEETLYEIEFDDTDKASFSKNEFNVGNDSEGFDEGSRRTSADRRRRDLKPENHPGKMQRRMYESLRNKYSGVIKEHTELKSKYGQTTEALKVFRDKLNEIAVFNSNLAHVVKIFMEHATTKSEKANILSRFDDGVATIKESKKMYKTIITELKDRKPLAENVKDKLNETLVTGTGTIKESTAYVDPQISKIHDLMERMAGK